MEKTVITIGGMRCGGCADRVRTVLEREPGVRGARVQAETGRAEIAFNPRTLEQDRLKEIIEAAGFQVVEVTE